MIKVYNIFSIINLKLNKKEIKKRAELIKHKKYAKRENQQNIKMKL
jgi:hypothetical protein